MKINSCNWITHGMNFEPGHIEMCCLRCHVGGGNIIFKPNYQGELLDWNEIFELKQKYIDENKRGEINPKCEGCFNLWEKDWDEENHYFNYLHFNHWTHCNCKCIYCFTDYNKEYFNSQRYYNVLPVIKDMFAKNLFKPGGEITFAGGEPTILDEFEELLDLLVENKVPKIIIHSSGIKYSPAIARGIQAGIVDVVLSLDAGCSETYKKIKNVNAYNKVVENVKKYAEAENKEIPPKVATKYIMMPEINDNIEEVEKWLTMTYESGVRSIVIDIEHEWFKGQREKQAFPQYCRDILYYIHERAYELGLQITLYNSARYFINNEQDFPNYDFVPYHYASFGKDCDDEV